MSSPSRRSNDHSTASFVALDTSYSDAVVQALYVALVVLQIVSEGRRLNHLNHSSPLQQSLALARMEAQPAVLPGQIARHQMSREVLPVRYRLHHICTRATLSLLDLIGTVSLGRLDWS
jgi:uncharacterized membrane protein YcjF (UPF0283 family)